MGVIYDNLEVIVKNIIMVIKIKIINRMINQACSSP